MKLKLFFANLLLTTSLSIAPAISSTYEALCNKNNCSIKVSRDGISTPNTFIPSTRIVQWFKEDRSYTNQSKSVIGAGGGSIGGAIVGGIATCWTVIACAPGIIAGGATGGIEGGKLGGQENYFFTIVGYNNKGDKEIISFRFKNHRPAAKLSQELLIVSGMDQGELRTFDIIKSLENFEQTSSSHHNNKYDSNNQKELPNKIYPLYY